MDLEVYHHLSGVCRTRFAIEKRFFLSVNVHVGSEISVADVAHYTHPLASALISISRSPLCYNKGNAAMNMYTHLR